jgi:hypothetical protein
MFIALQPTDASIWTTIGYAIFLGVLALVQRLSAHQFSWDCFLTPTALLSLVVLTWSSLLHTLFGTHNTEDIHKGPIAKVTSTVVYGLTALLSVGLFHDSLSKHKANLIFFLEQLFSGEFEVIPC